MRSSKAENENSTQCFIHFQRKNQNVGIIVQTVQDIKEYYFDLVYDQFV